MTRMNLISSIEEALPGNEFVVKSFSVFGANKMPICFYGKNRWVQVMEKTCDFNFVTKSFIGYL